MRPVHDAPALCMLHAVGLQVDHHLDRADQQAGRQQDHEQRPRPLGMGGHRVRQRQQRRPDQQHAAMPDALDDAAGEGQRDQRAGRGTDQA